MQISSVCYFQLIVQNLYNRLCVWIHWPRHSGKVKDNAEIGAKTKRLDKYVAMAQKIDAALYLNKVSPSESKNEMKLLGQEQF